MPKRDRNFASLNLVTLWPATLQKDLYSEDLKGGDSFTKDNLLLVVLSCLKSY